MSTISDFKNNFRGGVRPNLYKVVVNAPIIGQLDLQFLGKATLIPSSNISNIDVYNVFSMFDLNNKDKYLNQVYFTSIENNIPIINSSKSVLNKSDFEDLIKKHSNEKDIVLDTFLGGGTTLTACKNTNRICKGCEVSKEYYDKFMKILN